MGWDLEIAEAKSEYLTEMDLWRFTQQFLMNATHTTTYKYILMKALLECTTELSDSGVLTFEQISKHMTKMYWNLIVTHGLRQVNQAGKMGLVEQAMLAFQAKYEIPSSGNFNRLPDEQQQQLTRDVNRFYKKYVYGSFYALFAEIIYSFNRKEECVKLIFMRS